VDRIAALSHRRSLIKDELIFQQGDAGDTLYAVISGQVRISVSAEDGKEIFLNIMEPGDAFGEIALIDGEPRTATATAITDVGLITIERKRFMNLMEQEPKLAIHLLHVFCERLRWTSGLVEDAAFLDVPSRLAKRLLKLCERHGNLTDRGIQVDISQSELAQFLNVSRQKVNKYLQEWRKAGAIELARGKIVVCNSEEVKRLVQ